ncbi:MAG: hypothetical protein MR715_07805, partial [Subdoligranulum sp.]|nr:hypothetical protein [Subdoligranulum sp.]
SRTMTFVPEPGTMITFSSIQLTFRIVSKPFCKSFTENLHSIIKISKTKFISVWRQRKIPP